MASREPPADPRGGRIGLGEADVRPTVALPRPGLPAWAIGVIALAAGLILFAVLDARRRTPSAPEVRVEAGAPSVRVPPPPLFVPQEAPAPKVPTIAVPSGQPQAPVVQRAPPPQIVYVPQPVHQPVPELPPAPPPRVSAEPALVVDAGGSAGPAADGSPAPAAAGTAPAPEGRARSGSFANPSDTVVQGTLIPAVLETALDSSRPGLARAIVSRNVRGFDGRRILVPRGSRLVGEYRSDATPGQRRALVQWTRLIRPDGVTIAIGSPAGDPLGRVGIRARVNSHFLERFAGAILQSVLDIGVNLAAGSVNRGPVVVLPGGTQAVAPQVVQPSQVTPTLSVRPGTSISIFVARDLDFSRASGTR